MVLNNDHPRPFGYHDALALSALHHVSTSAYEEAENRNLNDSGFSSMQESEELWLAAENDLSSFSLQEEPVYPDVAVGRNLRRISLVDTAKPNMVIVDPLDGHSDTGLFYCHVPALLRYSRVRKGGQDETDHSSSSGAGPDFSGTNGDTVGGGNTGAIAYAASAAIMMGFHHANTGDGSVAPQLEGLNQRCPLRFTTEVLDEGGSGLAAVTALTSMVTRDPLGDHSPQPCALIGAHVSSATAKLASLAAVFDLPVVSSSAMSTTLNDAQQYPLFSRTHTDVGGFGVMAVSFLKQSLGVHHKFGMLFINDEYGHGYANSVLKASAKEGLEVVAEAYHVDSDDDHITSIRLALENLKESGCNYFVGSFYPGSLATIMGLAYDIGIAGPGKFWLISGTADIAPFVLGGALKLPKDSSAAKAIQGNGMYFCEGGVPGLGGSYDTFWKKWKEMGNNTQALQFVNSKQPLKKDGSGDRYAFPPVFQKKPHHVVTFSYDAAAGLALSACDAWEKKQLINSSTSSNPGVDMFSGSEHHAVFSKSSYYGASGLIEMGQDFPTRTAESSYFVMANLIPMEHNESHLTFKGSPIVKFFNTSKSTWKVLGGKQFVYSDDTITPPEELVPHSYEMGAATVIAIAVCAVLCLMGILMACIHRSRKKMDEVWSIDLEELHFDDDDEMLGKGSFGMVLLAEYRGTKVAVKRVLPPTSKKYGKVAPVQQLQQDEEMGDVSLGMSDIFGGENQPGMRSITRNGSSSNLTLGDTLPSAGRPVWGSGSEAPRRGFFYRSSAGGGVMQRHQFVREMRQLAALRHPNITTTVGAVLSPGKEPMMVMEFMEYGSLYDAMRNETISLNSKEDILTIIQDIAHGLHFLHAAKPEVIHGDLKSKNILIDSSFRAKISDFGLTARNKAGASGTPYWMAPELLRRQSNNTAMSDIYAFGIILYEVYSCEDPYKGEDYTEVIARVCDTGVRKRPPVPSLCPPNIATLMENCWQDRPEDRPTAKEIDSMLRGEGTIQGRVVRIEALNKQLLEKNHEISSEQAKQLEHFACMSHEIRTPLNCVIGLSTLLEEDKNLNLCQQDSLSMIVASGRLLRQVVDDVLDFSKFVSGNAEIEIKRIDLQQTLATVIKSMAMFPATEENHITIRPFYSPLLPQYIETDGRRLQQIVYNLLSNAVKFSKTNGMVHLTVSVGSRFQKMDGQDDVQPLLPSSAPPTLQHTSSAPPALCISIKDFGQGIAKSEFPKLFELFQQTDSGKAHGKGGTGLGLPIVKQLVELLGGSISVDSKVEEWTEFSLQIPLTVPLPDSTKITSTLKRSCVCLVSNQEKAFQYTSTACGHYQVPHQHFTTLKELSEQSEPLGEYKSCIILVQANLYDEEAFDCLQRRATCKVFLVAIGACGKIGRAQLAIPVPTQVFPSVFMQELCTLLKSKPQTPAPALENNRPASSQISYGQLKVLVVEDNLVNQKVISRLLSRIGVPNVKVAVNGQVAVDLEAEEPFDIIFMDIQMPVMGGVEACKRIVARTKNAAPKIVFLSANVLDDHEAFCKETGATDYLTKPCTILDLRAMMEKLATDERCKNGKLDCKDDELELSATGHSSRSTNVQ